MGTKAQNAESLTDQIFYLIENAVETNYIVSHDISQYAAEEGFKVTDIKDADVIKLITPKLQELVTEYLAAARTDEE